MSRSPQQLKEEGNALFKEGKFTEALRLYTEATTLLIEDNDNTKVLHGVLLANQALCLLKLSDWMGALQACNASLLVDDGNIKAKLRKLQALFELGRYEELLEIFREEPITTTVTSDYDKILQLANISDTVIKQRVIISDKLILMNV